MHKNKLLTKIIAALLCVTLLAPNVVSADSIDDVKDQQAELQGKMDSLQSELDSLRGDEAKAAEYQETLNEKIAVTEERIDTARNSIKKLNANIKELEQKLKTSEQEYSYTMEQLKERIKALYQAGDVGTVEILLNASSLYDFSLKTELLKSLTAHDKELMDKIREFMDATKADRDSLTEQKNQVASLKKQLEGDQDELEGLSAENEALIGSLQSKQSEKESKISQLEEEDKELNDRLAALVAQKRAEEEAARKKAAEEEAARKKAEEDAAQNQQDGSDSGDQGSDGSGGNSDDGSGDNSGGSSDGGSDNSSGGGSDGSSMSEGFNPRWPVPGVGTGSITGHYGDMYSNGPHNGLDIGAPYGTPIVAAQAGQVLSAEYHYSWGNNVFIYHNGTYSTRYAHMSSMAVSAGEYVEAGQIIGYVGSTGYSFGNHLHFEVYENDSRVNPDPYLGI